MKKSMKKAAVAALACAVLVPAAALGASKAKAEEPQAITEEVTVVAILRQGATGGEVKEVQRRLKLWGYYNGSVDGVFGAGTKKAVIAFQKKNGLTADGVVGAKTWEKLMDGSAVKEQSYRVIIRGLDLAQAKAICNNYPGSEMEEE